MKKSILSLALVTCLSYIGLAQTQRTILYEEFSGENCAPCAATNSSLMPFIHRAAWYPSKILLVKYQVAIPSAPGTGSLYQDDPTEGPARQSYYVPTVTNQFAPYARFNGVELPEPPSQGTGSNGHAFWLEDSLDYPNIIQDSAIVNSPFALTVNHVFNATYDSVIVTAVITAAQNYTASTSGALVLQLPMEEAYVHFATAPGTNGETDFYNVVRKMIPSDLGTPLNDNWTTAATQTVTLKAKIPTYIHDKNQICFVAFIQDNGPQRVHQAAFSAPKSVSLDASTTNINNSAVLCSTTIPVSATIKNVGATTMTSCNINYKLDAGTVTTFSWTGSLAQGASATYTFNITASAGTHTISVYTSLPNGNADQNTGNDKQTSLIVIEGTPSGTPVTEGFTATTFPPANWVKDDPLSGANSWTRNTSVGGYQTTSNSAMYPFYNNSAVGAIGNFFMPIEDLSAMPVPQLKFDYAYDYYDTLGTVGYDSVGVMVSTDCGNTWTMLWQQGGTGLSTATTPGNSNANGFTPTASEWKTQIISLSSYSTATSFLAKFVTSNQYGNNFYLDNVNINSSTAGIQQNHGNINTVNVYPNPASNQFNVDVNLSNTDKGSITIYNVMGQLLVTKKYDFNAGQNIINIPIDQLSDGVYTVLISSTEGIYQNKISVIK